MSLSAIIQQLGYSPSQAKLYLAALDMGEGIITDLADRAGLPRTSAQSTIVDMNRKGLVHFYLKHKRKYWIPAPPERLLNEQKQREQALKSILPQLQARMQIGSSRPSSQFLKGQEGIKQVMDDIIATKRHVWAVSSLDHWREMFTDEYTAEFIKLRNQAFLKMRWLTPRTVSSIALKRLDEKQNRHTRFLPVHIKIKNPNFIYGNKVAIASLNKQEPMGIIMEDEDIAQTMSWMFEGLWSQSSDT